MAIDNCKYSFQELSKIILPKYMKNMWDKITSPVQMSMFAENGVGKATAFKKLGIQKDFSDCYVLIENDSPIYVGISRTIIIRLLQHVKETTHFDVTLAYRVANEEIKHSLSRSDAMKTAEMKNQFKRAKARISKMDVAFIEIKNDIEIYLFEAYCAMELDTKKWNTFATH